MTRSIGLLAVVGLVTVASGLVWSDGDVPETTAAAPLPVKAVQVEPVSKWSKQRSFTGVIRAARTSSLGFERTGRLVQVLVTEGDQVERGQVLAQLDQQNLKAKRRELVAQQAAAQARLDELESGPRKQTIAATREQVRDLEAQVKLAKLDSGRRKRLLDSNASSVAEFERASLGLESFTARLAAAREELSELEEGTRQERIDAQKAAVDQLEAMIVDVDVDLAESQLVAPFAGVVGERFLDEGTIVSPGEAILRLVEAQVLEAWIGLPPHLADKFEPNTSVDLIVMRRGTVAGKVKATLPELDRRTRTRTVVFQLEKGAQAFPSEIVRVLVNDQVEASDNSGFWIPSSALSRGSRGLWSVLVVESSDDGRQVARKRDIEILHTSGDRALVRGTLNEGNMVIASGSHRVASGQSVTIADDPAFQTDRGE